MATFTELQTKVIGAILNTSDIHAYFLLRCLRNLYRNAGCDDLTTVHFLAMWCGNSWVNKEKLSPELQHYLHQYYTGVQTFTPYSPLVPDGTSSG